MKKILIISIVTASMISMPSESNAFLGLGSGDDTEMNENGRKGEGKHKRDGKRENPLKKCGVELSDSQKECMKPCHEKNNDERKSNRNKCKDAEDKKSCMDEVRESRENKVPCHEECGVSLTSEQESCLKAERENKAENRGNHKRFENSDENSRKKGGKKGKGRKDNRENFVE